jgi:hypothetical protein
MYLMDTSNPLNSNPDIQVNYPNPNKTNFYLLVIVVLLLLIIVGGGAFILGRYFSFPKPLAEITPPVTTNTPANSNQAPTPGTFSNLTDVKTPVSQAPADETANWKTYYSPVEKASFRYPSDWAIIDSDLESNLLGADQVALLSPSGTVKINWISAINGFGGGCDVNVPLGSSVGCPLFTLLEKTPIKGAPGLFVVSGTMTGDNKTFRTVVAVQDENGILETGRVAWFGLFQGRNNKSVSGQDNTTAIFSIPMTKEQVNGPGLNKTEAAAYFNKPEVKQAKLILESLSYTK